MGGTFNGREADRVEWRRKWDGDRYRRGKNNVEERLREGSEWEGLFRW